MNLELLDRARELCARESGLAVAVTCRADGSPHTSVVNAGVLNHPATGLPVVGFVARGYARKLDHLRTRPQASVVWRVGWEWVAVDGSVELAGPDDVLAGLRDGDLLGLLRLVYAAAVGGTADDWHALDDEFERERHTAVLVTPSRIYTNPEATS